MDNRILTGISICALALFGCLTEGLAQHAYFPMKGRITFEKEVYVRARMREAQGRAGGMAVNRWGGNLDDMPEKNTAMFVLQFDEDETLMMPQEETASAGTAGRTAAARMAQGRNRSGPRARPTMGGFRGRQQQKTYYQNLRTGEAQIELELDDKYLLKDSLQAITWRFTDEYRDIAGYECRRANGATADSLYIVAFYTDQIPLSGGPVLVGGLPGMILGLAIPEMHINYWARQVDVTVDNVPKQWRDKKSKAMPLEEFFRSLANNRAFGGQNQSETQMRRNVLEGLVY